MVVRRSREFVQMKLKQMIQRALNRTIGFAGDRAIVLLRSQAQGLGVCFEVVPRLPYHEAECTIANRDGFEAGSGCRLDLQPSPE